MWHRNEFKARPGFCQLFYTFIFRVVVQLKPEAARIHVFDDPFWPIPCVLAAGVELGPFSGPRLLFTDIPVVNIF